MAKTRKSGLPKAPHKIGIMEAARRFGDDELAQQWFIARRWRKGVICPYCGSDRIGERKARGKLRQWRCNDRKACGRAFTVKTNTIMHSSKYTLGQWLLGFYLYAVNLKGVASTQLVHEIAGKKQSHAWHMAHRIRKAMENDDAESFLGPVEADEVFIGGREINKHEWQRLQVGGGTKGKVPVVALKDRATKKVVGLVVERADQPTLSGFIQENTEPSAEIYTDEWRGYSRLGRVHKTVSHSLGEWVRGDVHTNGVEGWFSMIRRGIVGIHHWVSVKHLQRYISEFATRHNLRPLATEDRMEVMFRGGIGKTLPYAELVGKKETLVNYQTKLI